MNRGVSAQYICFSFNAAHTVCPAFLAQLVSHSSVAPKPALTLSEGRARNCSYVFLFYPIFIQAVSLEQIWPFWKTFLLLNVNS